MHARLDHLVVWVSDPRASVDFYEQVVGLPGVRAAEFRDGEAPFPSVRISPETILDLMSYEAMRGVDEGTGVKGSAGHPINHFCLSVGKEDFDALQVRLKQHGVEITGGGTNSFGAQGIAPETMFFPDPDGNVIEVRYYE
ncbi:VOC family protein [Nonomuraea gerenzanensis]|uniref:Glyoxalase/bleomycin resistance protein/dioxygenase n=1 Tax=Nonomuraea gerenzanensis TaxID=93944 RepID=A0A1M4DYF1_9ACTN|nr:VOC family protein [Nonomuraea gerenzanensis]UBU13925.1 VOC family protein [Nonomuraea gerenzanensis]SBO91608.1 Glyoxalase/bleomycin resistance protein/dioxygenase [Nonomuraea gerenzanensis]